MGKFQRKSPSTSNKRVFRAKVKLSKPFSRIKSKTSVKKKRPESFPIVGIGASAGGLEAFMDLFRLLPANTGLAFVLVQHLAPKHLSLLTNIIQKTTKMAVVEIEDGMKVQCNSVYVIPPNSILEILNGVLSLRPMARTDTTGHLIDTFFNSLARDHGHLAIGVVLSGTGSDGAQGLLDIKSAGGISLVQEPRSAKFDGMPVMAIKIDHPDRVLPVPGLVKELVKISQSPRLRKTVISEKSKLSNDDETALRKIFLTVRSKTGTDFSAYKYPTIIRRLKRRMLLNDIDDMDHYHSFLLTSQTEMKTLFSELIINVTQFFRDTEVFESIKDVVFSEILKNRPQDEAIRIWVPGCSTGEEVYSIAICLLEFFEEFKEKYPIQIYGTDVGDSIIAKARVGFYPESIEAQVSPDRLGKFFVKEKDGYKIAKSVRDCCVFSVQDVTIDPPIHRLDILSCRNLMIYLGAPAQQKLMETFFYALKPNGFLILGSSESVGPGSSYFSVADDRSKIFSKRTTSVPPRLMRTNMKRPESFRGVDTSDLSKQDHKNNDLVVDPVLEAEKLVLENYAPAWILVNQVMDIVHFKGQTDHVINPRSGHASLHLAKMLREELISDVRVLIHKVEKESDTARKNGIKINLGKNSLYFDIVAVPVGKNGIDPHFLILFYEHSDLSSAKVKPDPVPGAEVTRLRDELVATQKSLRSLLEDQSSANEELQSSNEEILSANEELQSTNEELETAKEELQSTNEELITVNEELSQRNSELSRVNDDLSNLLNSASTAVIMVNTELIIRRMTPAAAKLLNLKPADEGRRLTDFNLGFPIEELESKLLEVIQSLATLEYEISDRSGRHYLASIRPFKTHDRRVDGAVITFADIDTLKRKVQASEAARQYSNAIIQTMHEPLIVLDNQLKISGANSAFYKTFKAKVDETMGRSIFELGNGQWDVPELRKLLEDILPEKTEVKDFKLSHNFKKIGQRTMLINAQQLIWEGSNEILILLSVRDISQLHAEPTDSEQQ